MVGIKKQDDYGNLKKQSTLKLNSADKKDGGQKEIITDDYGRELTIKKPNADRLAPFGPSFPEKTKVNLEPN